MSFAPASGLLRPNVESGHSARPSAARETVLFSMVRRETRFFIGKIDEISRCPSAGTLSTSAGGWVISGVLPDAQLSPTYLRLPWGQVATKEHKRQAKELISTLESRVHAGPPICRTEISSAREFLRQSDFSPASDYFNRLTQIEGRIDSRVTEPRALPGKRNYGGEAAGRWLQLQSAY